MLELLNQLDGFDTRGDVKVIMATNKIESLDPALIRPGRIDRKIEFPLPDVKVRPPLAPPCLASHFSLDSLSYI
jgi:26S proteasome regulatory subunit T2